MLLSSAIMQCVLLKLFFKPIVFQGKYIWPLNVILWGEKLLLLYRTRNIFGPWLFI